jgi:hypothetical protein
MSETMNRDRKGVFLMFIPHNASANLLFVVSHFLLFHFYPLHFSPSIFFSDLCFTISSQFLHPRSSRVEKTHPNKSKRAHTEQKG